MVSAYLFPCVSNNSAKYEESTDFEANNICVWEKNKVPLYKQIQYYIFIDCVIEK